MLLHEEDKQKRNLMFASLIDSVSVPNDQDSLFSDHVRDRIILLLSTSRNIKAEDAIVIEKRNELPRAVQRFTGINSGIRE